MAYKYLVDEYGDEYTDEYQRSLYFNSNRRELFPPDDYMYRRPLQDNYRGFAPRQHYPPHHFQPRWQMFSDHHHALRQRYPSFQSNNNRGMPAESTNIGQSDGQDKSKIASSKSLCGTCSTQSRRSSMDENMFAKTPEHFTPETPCKLSKQASDPTHLGPKLAMQNTSLRSSPVEASSQVKDKPEDLFANKDVDDILQNSTIDIAGEETFDSELFGDLLRTITVLSGK